MTYRSGKSRYSATSGASQVALNAMRSTQDMLDRMELKQDTTQAQLNQRVDQAFQVIHMLAPRPEVIKSVTVPKVEAPTASVQMPTGPARHPRAEGRGNPVRRALVVTRGGGRKGERCLNEQWESTKSAQMQRLQEDIASLKEARNQDQKDNRRSKNVRGTSSSNTRVTSTEVRGDRSTVYPRSSDAIKDDAVHSQDTSRDIAFAAQLQLTLPSVTKTKYEKGDVQITGGQGSRIAKTSGSRAKSRQTEAKSTGAARSEDKEPPKKELRNKTSRQDEDPSGTSSSSESSEEDDSPNSDSSSDGMPLYTTMVTNAKVWEHAHSQDIHQRIGRLRREAVHDGAPPMKFMNLAIQAGWSDQMKIYEFKTKMSPAARKMDGSARETFAHELVTTGSGIQARVLQVPGVGFGEVLHDEAVQG
ncbi:LOW QUALITY PROTEIN: hypothetical protein PHMEG_00034939 [Phytophthora megakarya]|uniref:Uncharacterized protein n=1 Tax=Phytophthora megakarya TaxID=4795 RepID=A0A225URE4_9STRA|nr:LOW QUALITY PROTEIN: hypothetical protein PHMEG_00034939 [Phytophthora megakarya]